MMNETNLIKKFFLGLPTVTGFFLIGCFFLVLGVTFLPVIGIFVGLAVFYLGFQTVPHIMSALTEAIEEKETGQVVP